MNEPAAPPPFPVAVSVTSPEETDSVPLAGAGDLLGDGDGAGGADVCVGGGDGWWAGAGADAVGAGGVEAGVVTVPGVGLTPAPECVLA